jgi:uncharacterized protein YidB (DUF937 family)
MTKARWAGLGLGVLVILAAFGLVAWQGLSVVNSGGIALAQAAPTPTPTLAPNPKPTPQTKSDIGDQFWSALAAKLGISVDDLKAKALQVRKDMIDQAVKDGRLTQAQADAIKARLDANSLIAPINIGRGGVSPWGGVGPQGGGRGFLQGPKGGGTFGFPFAFGGSSDQLEAVAKALKLSPSDLTTQLREKSLAEIAKAQNVDEATVKQAIIDAAKAQIQRAVQDGILTQAQADQMLKRLTPDQIDLSRTPRMRGFGWGGWDWGGFGRGWY